MLIFILILWILSTVILRNVYEKEEIGSKGQKAVKTTRNLGQRKFTEVNPISEGGGHIVPPPTKYHFKSGYLGARTPQTH